MPEVTRDEVMADFYQMLSELPDEIFRSTVHTALKHVFTLYDFPQPDGSIAVYVTEVPETAIKGH